MKLSDGHIQILGAAANDWLSGGKHGVDPVFFISTYAEVNGKQVARGLKSNPRPTMVLKMIKDGLLAYNGTTDRLLLTERGLWTYKDDGRTVEVEAGRKLQVIAKPVPIAAADLSDVNRPYAGLRAALPKF